MGVQIGFLAVKSNLKSNRGVGNYVKSNHDQIKSCLNLVKSSNQIIKSNSLDTPTQAHVGLELVCRSLIHQWREAAETIFGAIGATAVGEQDNSEEDEPFDTCDECDEDIEDDEEDDEDEDEEEDDEC